MKPEPIKDKHDVPLCDDGCHCYDGKRCELLGHRPDVICAPAVESMIVKTERLEEEVRDQARVIAAAYARADEYERYANYNAELIEGRDATIAELQGSLARLLRHTAEHGK